MVDQGCPECLDNGEGGCYNAHIFNKGNIWTPMSRFHVTTVFLALAAPAIGFSTQGAVRWGSLGILFALYGVIFALGLSVLKLNFFVKAICRGEAGGMRVALSFDDGPDPASTPRLLDVLERCGIRAAFFVVGVKTAAHPEVVRRMERQGHIVGNHSYGHAWWTNFLTGRRLDR